MNRKISGIGAIALLALVGMVSATTYYALYYIASNFVLNSANAADNDDDYATLQYATNITCPSGNFSAYSGAPSNFCKHNPSGALIGGWEVIQFGNASYVNASNITVQASDFNLGCTSCASGIAVEVFRSSSSTYDSNTVWTYVGQFNFADNANRSSITMTFSPTQLKYVLIGRWSGGNHRPDPAVHKAYVQG